MTSFVELKNSLAELRNDSIVVRLFPWEEIRAREVGVGRVNQNKDKGNRISYDETKLMSDNVLASIHAAVAEVGVARCLQGYWHASVWEDHHDVYKELPDVEWGGVEVEVKWRRSAFDIPVDRKDAERNRLLIWAEGRLAKHYGCACSFCEQFSTPAQYSRVRVLGGGYTSELWELGKIYNDDPNRMAVPINRLTGIRTILQQNNVGLAGAG